MDITGKVLREVEFRDRLRGYDTDEVDEFLEEVAVAVDELLIALARRFDEALTLWDGGGNFAAIRAAWLEHAAGLGGRIRVSGREGAREGVFEGLDRDGRLLFGVNGAIETIESADLALISDFSGASPVGTPPNVLMKAVTHE